MYSIDLELCFVVFVVFTCAGGQKDIFVKVQIFKELHAEYEKVRVDSHEHVDRNSIILLGAKGLGKTRFLQYLAKYYKGTYIDLLNPQLTDILKDLGTSNQPLFIDNAQVFENVWKEMPSLRTLAAFSPAVSITSKRLFKKACGDGRTIQFYYRPFTYEEAKTLVIKHGYDIEQFTDELYYCTMVIQGIY